MPVSFTDRELDVMAVLWERGPSTVAEVRAALEDELAYNTVLTVLRTLEDKGYVGHQEAGRAYVVGNVTAGDDMDAELEELPTGAYLVYASGLPHTPKGAVVEGRGVKPDLEVNLTRAGLLRGVDEQLDAALRYVLNQKTSKGNY